MGVLSNFRQTHAWDAQRVGGKYHEKYREYATVAIGLYGAAAGIPEPEILRLQDEYARFFSHFGPNTEFDNVYAHLPADNVQNTHLGYDLYQSYIGARPVR